jgi:hypothetical protein
VLAPVASGAVAHEDVALTLALLPLLLVGLASLLTVVLGI